MLYDGGIKIMYEIEKGIPIPRRKSSNIYPWRQMEIGDSFVASISKKTRQGLCRCAQRIGIKIVTRTLPDG